MVSHPLIAPPSRDAAAYGHWSSDHIRYSDLDAVGHANNNAIGVIFEHARVHMLRDMGIAQDGGNPLCVLANLNLEFLAELKLFDKLRIGQHVARIGNTSFTLQSALFVNRGEAEICAATCQTVIVVVDGEQHRPFPIPDHARSILQKHS